MTTPGSPPSSPATGPATRAAVLSALAGLTVAVALLVARSGERAAPAGSWWVCTPTDSVLVDSSDRVYAAYDRVGVTRAPIPLDTTPVDSATIANDTLYTLTLATPCRADTAAVPSPTTSPTH